MRAMNPFSLVNQILPKMHRMPKICNCIKLCKPGRYCASLVVMVTKLNPIRSVLRALSTTKSAKRARSTFFQFHMRRELKYCSTVRSVDILVFSFLIVINQELNCLISFFRGCLEPSSLMLSLWFPPSRPASPSFRLF